MDVLGIAADRVGGGAPEALGLTRPVRIGGRGQDITRRRDERTLLLP